MRMSNDWVGERGLAEYEASHLGEAIDRAITASQQLRSVAK